MASASLASVPAAELLSEREELVLKVQQQARRLVDQQRQLVCAIEYARRCEARLRQLDPAHPLPVTAEHLEQPPIERAPNGLPTPWCPPAEELERSRAASLDMSLRSRAGSEASAATGPAPPPHARASTAASSSGPHRRASDSTALRPATATARSS
eukprot:3701309-Prymnesium_polylepis.1